MRDKFTCQYCGASPSKNLAVKLHVDHINPKANNGKDSKSNLITACRYCNLGKGHSFYPKIFILDFIKSLATPAVAEAIDENKED